MAKKVFKMDNIENASVQNVPSAQDALSATAAPAKQAAAPVVEAVSASYESKIKRKIDDVAVIDNSKSNNTKSAYSENLGDSRARTVSDKYSTDLIVKNLLKKSGELPAMKESATFGESADAEKPAAQELPEFKVAIEQNKKENDNKTETIRAKKISEKYSADLVMSSILKGEASPATAVTKTRTIDDEMPKGKKIFKAVPDDPASADLGAVDEPPKPDKPRPAEKRVPVKADKEYTPIYATEKKQPVTFVLILKTIYRVTITTFKALILTVPFLAVIAYTNMYIDPGRLYHIDRDDMFEYDIVRMMREGHNVENLNNYNERLVKREYINQLEEPVDVIIAGSSRGALITKEMLNVDSMFNTSVSGGSLDDVIGFYGVLYQYDLLPKTFIIVLDPWMLNDNHYDNRYERSIGDGYYNYMTTRMGYSVSESLKEIDSIYEPGSDEPISFWDLGDDVKWNLISITYFQASIQRYFSASTMVRPDTWPSPTDSEDGESAFLRPDGSIRYPLSYRTADAEKASSRARMSFPESIIGLEDYSVLESNRKQILIDFLKCVQEDGVEVKIVVEPISNVIVEYMKVFERYENFFKAEEMVYNIAALFGIEITGSFDPEKLEYDMNCFYDGYHLKEQYIEEIVRPFKL